MQLISSTAAAGANSQQTFAGPSAAQAVCAETRRENAPVEPPRRLARGRYKLVYQSQRMQHLIEQARRFARSSATVLITGESGTGKELVARLIHDASPRARRRFARINCAALPETLVESELFGYEKGAFTGATETRVGRFEWASGGTLLLDEISEIPVRVQAKLLRVLEDEEFQRVGDNTLRYTDVRVIATSNRDLHQEIENGSFRSDLYHRLNVLELRLPALRERPEDIPLLVTHFIEQFQSESAVPVRGVSRETMKRLVAYHWPGNVRQLRNVIHHACIVATGDFVQPEDLPVLAPSAPAIPDAWLDMRLDEVERHVILTTLERHHGNKRAAAEKLGVTARTLANKIKLYRQQGLI